MGTYEGQSSYDKVIVLCLNVVVVGPVLVSHHFKTVIYYELNIKSHGPVLSSRISHSLCCFISLINVFLMTVCV